MSVIENADSEREPLLLNALNREYLTGKRKRPETKLIWWQAESLILAVSTLIVALPLLSYILNNVRVSLVGVPATATVSNHLHTETGSGRGRSIVYTLVFVFPQGSRTIRVKQDVPQDILDAHTIGSMVTIRYLPNEPETARLSGPDSFNDPFLEGYILIPLMLFLWSVAATRRWMRLDREERHLMPQSTLISGQVESVTTYTFKGLATINVQCSFKSPGTGRLLRYNAAADRRSQALNTLPDVGTPMLVLYYSDQHFWVL